jgi:hypothetical protein
MEIKMSKTLNINLLIVLVLIAFGVMLRFMPHPANFAPITAIAIFGGAMLPLRFGVWVPLGAMVVSDFFIGFHPLVSVTWGCFLLIAVASSVWMKKRNIVRGVSLVLASSVLFFVVTNFAVWLTSGLYPITLNGLVNCYYMALPFFRNSLLGDIFYTAVIFSLYAVALKMSKRASATT